MSMGLCHYYSTVQHDMTTPTNFKGPIQFIKVIPRKQYIHLHIIIESF